MVRLAFAAGVVGAVSVVFATGCSSRPSTPNETGTNLPDASLGDSGSVGAGGGEESFLCVGFHASGQRPGTGREDLSGRTDADGGRERGNRGVDGEAETGLEEQIISPVVFADERR